MLLLLSSATKWKDYVLHIWALTIINIFPIYQSSINYANVPFWIGHIFKNFAKLVKFRQTWSHCSWALSLLSTDVVAIHSCCCCCCCYWYCCCCCCGVFVICLSGLTPPRWKYFLFPSQTTSGKRPMKFEIFTTPTDVAELELLHQSPNPDLFTYQSPLNHQRVNLQCGFSLRDSTSHSVHAKQFLLLLQFGGVTDIYNNKLSSHWPGRLHFFQGLVMVPTVSKQWRCPINLVCPGNRHGTLS